MAYTTINKSSDFFNTLIWSGNGSTRSITNLGFKPDITWIKSRTSTHVHSLQSMPKPGTGAYLETNSTSQEQSASGRIASFDSDGFSLGTAAQVNGSGNNYVGWNWKAGNSAGSSNTDGSITSTVSVNTTAGCSVVWYQGNDTAGATVGHGLGATPDMIIMKNFQEGGRAWQIYHKSLGNTHYLQFDTNAQLDDAGAFNDTSPTSSVFTLGASNRGNENNKDQIAYCFAEKTGYSKFGSYTGNGNADGSFIYTGFKPAFVIFKQTDASRDWLLKDNKRPSYQNVNDTNIYPNTNAAEDTPDNSLTDFLSNGFKIRNTGSFQNASGGSYIYMAIGQSLVGTNNVPCTAR